jgi:hypothetical protein
MNLSKRDERRRFLRRQLKQPDIAAVWPHEMNPVENNSWDNGNRLHYVDVSDRSSGGVLVKASRPFSNGRQLYLASMMPPAGDGKIIRPNRVGAKTTRQKTEIITLA